MKRITLIGLLMFLSVPVMLLGAEGGIMGWMVESWKPILGVLVFMAGGFYVPGVRTLLFHALKAAISGPVLKRLAIEALQKYVDSTETTVDNAFLDEFKRRTMKVKSI